MSSDLMFSTMSKILTGVSTCLHNNIQLLVERVSKNPYNSRTLPSAEGLT